MSVLGFVVIEYNQASKWPSLESDTLFDSETEAREMAQHARDYLAISGRGETYAVARVELIEPHSAFADPIEGGNKGYEAACWDCDWRCGHLHDDKTLAQAEASRHRQATT